MAIGRPERATSLDSVHITTTVRFAFTELLGFKLLPRMKNIGAIELYSPDAIQTAWPKVDKILKKRPIDCDLIARNYDQMIKYATALRLRTAETEQVLRRFMKGNGPKHPVYLALTAGSGWTWRLGSTSLRRERTSGGMTSARCEPHLWSRRKAEMPVRVG
ncbi:Tn3 family transposase [Nonomuraea sp. H19]|uniref:Tn3 family transposase n=1 Tax=Nonomuraea sp. H19 TaxID=3452206 RepID=UPI003F88C844